MSRGTKYNYKDYHRINEKGELEKKCTKHAEYYPEESEWMPCNSELFYINTKNKGDGLCPECKKCAIQKTYKNKRLIKRYNDYKIIGDETIIYLKRKSGIILECIIDTEDFDKIKDYYWVADIHKDRKGLTFAFCQDIKKRIHQLIVPCDAEEGEFIDHINGDGLLNKKINLRVITNKGNLTNMIRRNINNSSGYPNVHWNSNYNQWMVQLQLNGKSKNFGYFDDVDEAGKLAEEMRQKYYTPVIKEETFFNAID